MNDFPWHKLWLMVAIGSFLFGALGFAILFGLASWYCWPPRGSVR